MEVLNTAEILLTVLYRRDREWSPKMEVNCVIIAISGHYIWKAIPPEASKRGRPNLELEL